MKLTLDHQEPGWYELSIGLLPAEVDQLISLLIMVRDDPAQHFHLSHDDQRAGGPGRVTFYASSEGDEPNAVVLGETLLPGDPMPE